MILTDSLVFAGSALDRAAELRSDPQKMSDLLANGGQVLPI